MDISLQTSYNAALADVVALLLSEDLAHERARALRVTDFSFKQERPEPTLIHSVLRARVPASELPSQLRSFLTGGLNVRIESTYHSERTPAVIEHDVHIDGAPVSAALIFTLTPASSSSSAGIGSTSANLSNPVVSETVSDGEIISDAGGSAATSRPAVTRAHITGSFSVRVPFIGAKIERVAAAHANDVLRADTALVHSLLAR
ncbi:MAG: DUF2505 domain-containing protein [Actinomycetaceae bacterium]|nr:DUF2505 domain-containing protein [Arcanobacterium sp.]MDD7687723.1 DUF2505 domain-containing protein [Actinomycetaceae bacterium]MDY5274246.1 DUF2505 domain-containing protein [Arcanobacterium sp.]